MPRPKRLMCECGRPLNGEPAYKGCRPCAKTYEKHLIDRGEMKPTMQEWMVHAAQTKV